MSISLSALTYPAIDPVLLRLGPVAIRWYGLAYVAGFALAYLVLRWMQRRKHLALSGRQLPACGFVTVGQGCEPKAA